VASLSCKPISGNEQSFDLPLPQRCKNIVHVAIAVGGEDYEF
jgi:hypothetical protein